MSQIQKIDYHNLVDKGIKSMPANADQDDFQEEKMSALERIKSKWDFMDKKVKVEIIIFTIVIIGIITMFSLYLYNRKPSYSSDEGYDESVTDHLEQEEFIEKP